MQQTVSSQATGLGSIFQWLWRSVPAHIEPVQSSSSLAYAYYRPSIIINATLRAVAGKIEPIYRSFICG